MRIAYVDMIGGAAGDMLLAAFLDAGLDRDALERALRGVVADGWTLAPRRVVKRGIAATYAGLVVPGEDGDDEHHHHHDEHDERRCTRTRMQATMETARGRGRSPTCSRSWTQAA